MTVAPSPRDARGVRTPAAGAFALLAGGALLAACGVRPVGTEALGPRAASGYRALFRGESHGPGGKSRFRMACALLPPDRVRLEFFGPTGGPRLVIVADGTSATALLPSERAYDRAEATPATLERMLGVPLDAARLSALLTGRPMCRPEAAEQQLRTRAALAFGRTSAWYELSCPAGEILYQASSRERGGIIDRAAVRDGTSGAIILEVEYGDHEEGLGPRWPRRIHLRLPRRQSVVTLTAIEGPKASSVESAIFVALVPEGFERRPDLLSLPAPGLLGSTGEREE